MTNKLSHILHNIQALRAIAALLVVFYHTSAHFFVVGGEQSGNIFSFISSFGYIGVDIFFVISGYIMWISTYKTSGFHGFISFIYSRLTRIYLTYWIFLSMMYYFYHKSLYNFDVIGSIFLTVTSSSKLLLQVAWTLQYELYFYMFFSILLFFNRKYFLNILLTVFILIILVQIYGVINIDTYAKNVLNGASTLDTFWTSPFILEFLFGSFVGYYFDSRRIKYLLPLTIFVLVIIIVSMKYQNLYIDGSFVEGYYLPQRILFFGTISMLILAIFVELNKRDIIIFSSFSLLVGGASYGLYLSHNIILLFLYQIGVRDTIKEFGQNQTLFMLLIVICITLCSIMYYHFIEKYLMRYANSIKRKYLFVPKV